MAIIEKLWKCVFMTLLTCFLLLLYHLWCRHCYYPTAVIHSITELCCLLYAGRLPIFAIIFRLLPQTLKLDKRPPTMLSLSWS